MSVRRRRRAGSPPCPWCGRNRWRTMIKGLRWRCRNCHAIEEVADL